MSWLNKAELRGFRNVGVGVRVSREAVIYGSQNIDIGDNTRIDSGVLMLASSEGAELIFGAHIHVAARAIFMASGGIKIGDFSVVGFGSKLISASDDFNGDCLVGPVFPDKYLNVHKDGIEMQMHCLVTTDCTLLPGTKMMEGSVLGAMSLIKGQTKPWTIYAGVPAKERKERSNKALALGIEWSHQWQQIRERSLNNTY